MHLLHISDVTSDPKQLSRHHISSCSDFAIFSSSWLPWLFNVHGRNMPQQLTNNMAGACSSSRVGPLIICQLIVLLLTTRWLLGWLIYCKEVGLHFIGQQCILQYRPPLYLNILESGSTSYILWVVCESG